MSNPIRERGIDLGASKPGEGRSLCQGRGRGYNPKPRPVIKGVKFRRGGKRDRLQEELESGCAGKIWLEGKNTMLEKECDREREFKNGPGQKGDDQSRPWGVRPQNGNAAAREKKRALLGGTPRESTTGWGVQGVGSQEGPSTTRSEEARKETANGGQG